MHKGMHNIANAHVPVIGSTVEVFTTEGDYFRQRLH